MLIKIEELSGPNKSSKGDWNEIKLVYSNPDNPDSGTKVKNIVSFGDGRTVFEALKDDKYSVSDLVNVKVVKDGKFWNWVGLSPASGNSASGSFKSGQGAPQRAAGTQGSFQANREWETAEERYKRNLCICRQNALTNAVSFSDNKKATADDVLALASKFFKYTTQDVIREADVMKDLKEELNKDDDVPF